MARATPWLTIAIVFMILLLATLIALVAVVLVKVENNSNSDNDNNSGQDSSSTARVLTLPSKSTKTENHATSPPQKPSTSSSMPVTGQCPADPVVWQDLACCRKSCPLGWGNRPLLLVSLDGFRADYLQRNLTPSIQRMIDCGSHAPFMFPSYPSVTFPNHYSIVTGLHPESHGIVDNRMYDPTITNKSNTYFNYEGPTSLDPQWWLGEPVDMTPTYWLPYNGSVPFYQRTDTVIQWLLLPEIERPRFITLYFDEPDHTGHDVGPYAGAMNDELITIDAFINYLMRRLYENDLMNCLDVVIVADHGMELTTQSPYMGAESYFNISVKDFDIFTGPVGRVQVETSGYTPEYIFNQLVCQNNFSRVYFREDVPKRFHYSVTPRIGDVVIDMDDSYMFEEYNDYKPGSLLIGDHGYDFKYYSMHALFVAFGPSFKQNFQMTPFQNIELYNLFADMLNIPLSGRAPNNGTRGVLNPILMDPSSVAQPTYQQIPVCTFQNAQYQDCGDCGFLSSSSKCQNSFNLVVAKPFNVGYSFCGSQSCDYGMIYNEDLNLPIMVENKISYNSVYNTDAQLDCSLLSTNTQCYVVDKMQNLSLINASMYPLLDFNAATSTASTLWYGKVPMYDGFYQGAWQWVQNVTINYAKAFQQIIVFAGPIFDYDYNGLADPIDVVNANLINGFVVPTHFYQIILRCDGTFNTNGTCHGNPDVLSYVVPNEQVPINPCQTPDDYLFKNTARVIDIEALTGLEYFTNWNFTLAVLLRTRINDQL